MFRNVQDIAHMKQIKGLAKHPRLPPWAVLQTLPAPFQGRAATVWIVWNIEAFI